MSILVGNPFLLNTTAATGYQVSRSLRFNSADSAYLSRTPGSAGNRKTWTWSGWVKTCNTKSSEHYMFSAAGSGQFFIFGISNNDEFFINPSAGAGGASFVSSNLFRDRSAWYHFVVSFDSTQATSTNRLKVYVNGTALTWATASYPAQNTDWHVNNNVEHRIGSSTNGTGYIDQYLADIYFLDGTATDPSTFAETDAVTGQWVPKTPTGISYGTNGFRLTFSDNSGTTSTTLGKDAAGSNNWSPNNFSVASGSGNDSLVDTPTSYGTDTGAGGEVRGNYATLNPLAKTVTLSNGNLDATGANSGTARTGSTIAVSSGKWYWEVTFSPFGSINDLMVGIMPPNNSLTGSSDCIGFRSDEYGYYAVNGAKYNNGSSTSYGASFLTSGDVIGVALNLDAGTLTFYKNGTSQGQAYSGISGTFMPAISGGGTASANATCNFGQRAFAYTAPSGFKALCDTNLTSPTIAKPNTVFDVKLYTGNGGSQTINGYAFSPDLVWIKQRSGTTDHGLFDTVRGVYLQLRSNTTAGDNTVTNALTSFTSDGYVLGGDGPINFNGWTYVNWAWDAGTSTVTNTQGSITSSVRANASAGFSIVSYNSGSSTGNFTLGHGLNVAPKFIIHKSRSTSNWWVYHASVVDDLKKYMQLNSTNAIATNSNNMWGGAFPTSSVFGVTVGDLIGTSQDAIAYVFSPVAGYSSISSWVGNGSSDGVFVWTGFRPRFLIWKNASGIANWYIYDSARSTYNVTNLNLEPNTSDAENTLTSMNVDFLSNGFKIRGSDGDINGNGSTYIYAAFAESPFQYARAK